jgi:hypothetical protein
MELVHSRLHSTTRCRNAIGRTGPVHGHFFAITYEHKLTRAAVLYHPGNVPGCRHVLSIYIDAGDDDHRFDGRT